MAIYYALGIEPFKQAEVYGVHASKQTAENQIKYLNETNKNTCQRFEVLSKTQVKKQKLELYLF